MSDEATERVHWATPHRRQVARQQGHVAKSYDAVFAAVFLAGLALLLLGGSRVLDALAQYVRQQLSVPELTLSGAAAARDAWFGSLALVGPGLALVWGVVLCVAVVAHLLQTGFQPLPERLAPDLSRFHPLSTAAHLFSGGAVALQLLNLCKLVAMLGVAGWALWDQRVRIATLGGATAAGLAVAALDILGGVCLRVSGVLLIVAAADYAFRRWRYEVSLRMTPEELREEMRTQNGDPAVQRRRRQRRSDANPAQLEAAVQQAQLVLVHGTSAAVALQYDPRTMSAPIVVAKGHGAAAERIRQAAAQAGIRVAEEARLARRIAQQSPSGGLVAAEHYQIIASLMC